MVRPKMVLHCVAGSTMLHTRAANIPKQMTNWFTLPRVPRKCVGATCAVPSCNQLRPAVHSTQPYLIMTTQQYASSVTLNVDMSKKLVIAQHTVYQHCAALLAFGVDEMQMQLADYL